MKTRTIITTLLIAVCTNIAYATDFVTFKRNSLSDIELTGTSDTITYDPLDWKGVRMAVENLRHDLKAVTGSADAPIVVGTIGKSKLAKKYKVATQMGNQGNSFDWCRQVAEWIWNDEIGEVREVH